MRIYGILINFFLIDDLKKSIFYRSGISFLNSRLVGSSSILRKSFYGSIKIGFILIILRDLIFLYLVRYVFIIFNRNVGSFFLNIELNWILGGVFIR